MPARSRVGMSFVMAAAMAMASVLVALGATSARADDADNDWAEYVHDMGGSGYTAEAKITPANAAMLQPLTGWNATLRNDTVCPSGATCSNSLAAQPVLATVDNNPVLYVGSWNGSEYALCAASQCTLNGVTYSLGQTIWSYYLGRTSGCYGPHNSKIFGVSSTPAVADVVIRGLHRTLLFVGGGGNIFRYGNVDPAGQAKIYALDARTGQRIWERSLGAAPAAYTWSSPRVANGSVYVGLASLADCPLVQGKLFQLDPAWGTVRNSFKVVPDGCIGGGIWGTVTVGPTGNLYVSTGNDGTCWTREPLFESVLRLSPDLKLLGSWQVPPSERVADGDFGSVPTLFMGTVSPGAPLRYLVGIANKNGTYYVFDRNSISAGPIKRLRVGFSISPSSWDGKRIYVGAGVATIQGTSYGGSLRAFDPNNLGQPLWERGFGALVLPAVTSSPGLVAAVTGTSTVVVSSETGVPLFSKGSGTLPLFGAASISHGVLWQGDRSGAVLAFSVLGQ